ncbi:MAG TPA: hypothetical protein VF656_06645 [Pyrinomonadaceae bacterium]|jgi:hypothetical protein
MPLDPETVLKRRPYLRLSLNSSDEVQVSVEGATIKCGLHALYLLELFSRPLSVAAAIKQLGARYESKAERIAAIATLFRLQEGGALLDAAAQTDAARGDLSSGEIYFECALDEATRALRPYREREARAAAEHRTPALHVLELNPRVFLQTGTEPPAPLAARLAFLDHFSTRRPIAWLEDAFTKALAPYWLGREDARAFKELAAGEVAPAALDAGVAARLAEARILIEPQAEAERERAWERTCADLRRDLQTEQHAVFRKLIDPLQLAALRRYFRALDAAGRLKASSNKHYAHRRRSVYDEETARFVQQQTTALVSRITPAPVSASHCQVSVYQPGALLRRHRDQPQYVWNLSLVMDAEPETGRENAWPICIEVEGRTHEVRLEIGDAVLYRGSELTHWRDVLPDNQSVTLLFCFFAPEESRESSIVNRE